jgi:hypothetical protein
VPQPSDDVYVVLNDYGKLSIAYEETDPAKARPIGAAAGRRTGNSRPRPLIHSGAIRDYQFRA